MWRRREHRHEPQSEVRAAAALEFAHNNSAAHGGLDENARESVIPLHIRSSFWNGALNKVKELVSTISEQHSRCRVEEHSLIHAIIDAHARANHVRCAQRRRARCIGACVAARIARLSVAHIAHIVAEDAHIDAFNHRNARIHPSHRQSEPHTQPAASSRRTSRLFIFKSPTSDRIFECRTDRGEQVRKMMVLLLYK